jgi:glycosyltransferase involved in cell wall biosynthesis
MSKVKLPRVAIIGSRGIPANYGGFETFSEEIAVHLVKMYGYEVTVVCDAEQKQHNTAMDMYQGVNLRYSSYAKGGNAIGFYHDSIKQVLDDHDIIYSCGPAGGLFGFMVRRHGKIMMTNPDGLNSRRSKWSKPVQLAFRAFEFAASRFSDWVVCDSKAIETYIRQSYRCKHTFVAEYGAYTNPYIREEEVSNKILASYGVKSGEYHLVVSRLEPENNVEEIVYGFQQYKRKWPLIIVGNLQKTVFVQKLQAIAGDNIHFVGGIYDKDKLAILRAHSATYLHGHSVGGTNPSLLEAMGSHNLCICHDNTFNREVVSDHGLFFKDADDVSEILQKVEANLEGYVAMRDGVMNRVVNYYNWENMANKYNNIFLKAMDENHS